MQSNKLLVALPPQRAYPELVIAARCPFRGGALALCFGWVWWFSTASAQSQPLQSGGLAPPPTQQPQPPQPEARARTLQRLQAAEHKDAGRRLEFVWVDGRVGARWLALEALSGSGLLDDRAHSATAGGLEAQGALGVRLVFVTAGLRYRRAFTEDFDLWSVGAEAGLHWPMGRWEPSVVLGAGYASLSGLTLPTDGSKLEASGFDVHLGGELSWYLDPLLSLGAYAEATLIRLSRDASPTADSSSPYATEGSGTGLSVGGGFRAGFHF